jgi:alpha-beta hydrolase superfamily lysophospholipase
VVVSLPPFVKGGRGISQASAPGKSPLAPLCQRGEWNQYTESGEKVELPPALLIQGTADKGVPQGMVEKVAELYRAAGGDVEPTLFPDMPHGIAGWSEPEVKNMIERTKNFIAQHLTAAVTR